MQTAMVIGGKGPTVCQHWQQTSLSSPLRLTSHNLSMKPDRIQQRKSLGIVASTLETNFPIIDSHIHLFPASELPTIPWLDSEPSLKFQTSVENYRATTASCKSNLKGFVFLEVSRQHDLAAGIKDGSGWEAPLIEVELAKRIALGTPREGEGHTREDAELCLAIVPWAPVPCGKEVIVKYVSLVEERAGEARGKIRGYRYLPSGDKGEMLRDGFIESLKWMGTKGVAFDVGLNHHENGDWQLEECLEMVRRVHEGVEDVEKVTLIINHFCKPDMTIFKTGSVTDHPSFIFWRDAMGKLSKCSNTYVKLSGGLQEIPIEYIDTPAEEVFEVIQPWLLVVLEAFGPSRIMFGSDWPVCNTGGGSTAWEKWRWIVQRLCQVANLSKEDESMLWGGTAIKACGIKDLP